MAPLGDPVLLRAEMEKTVGIGGRVTAASWPNRSGILYGPLPTVIKMRERGFPSGQVI